MKLLAFDLSTRRGTIALAENEEILCAHDWQNNRRTSAPLFTALNQVIREYGAPEHIVTGLGPGSYTGTRIAISAGIGLHVTGRAALSGMPSVCAISDENEYWVIGDAKRASFFFATVRGGLLTNHTELVSEDELNERISSRATMPIYSSDDLPRFDRVTLRFPSARLLCRLARTFPQKLVPTPLSPIYLREPHITTPRTTLN
jgi:tRNA threonylcarbamoyladenosine biosynthesis protein TsaB